MRNPTAELDSGAGNPETLPSYAKSLAMFHREFRPELSSLVANLPLPNGASSLDVGCGDGFYSALIAERSDVGQVVGVDVNRAMLRLAETMGGTIKNLSFRELKLDHLDDLAASYDLVWCAQSLFSFVDERAAVATMAARLKPGGVLAVLENDYLHQLLLPWPADVELILRRAELSALQDQTAKPNRYYVGRRLPRLLANAGLAEIRFRTQAIDRAAPLSAELVAFVGDYLEQLRRRCEGYLTPSEYQRISPLLDPLSDQSLLKQPQLTLTWLNNFAFGRAAK